jgi:hypothetical protein
VASRNQIDESKFQKQSVDLRMAAVENPVVAVDITSTSSSQVYGKREMDPSHRRDRAFTLD